MGLFNFFKKNKAPEYDATNLSVADLQVGFVFDYNLTSYEVLEVYEYDWGDEHFSFEFKISDGTQILFLAYENDDEVSLSLSQKVRIQEIDHTIPSYISTYKKALEQLSYKGVEYFLDSETPGFFHIAGTSNESWSEFISWNYENKDGSKIVTIEQWGEREFEASIGKTIKEFEISNILPCEQ